MRASSPGGSDIIIASYIMEFSNTRIIISSSSRQVNTIATNKNTMYVCLYII